MVLAKTIEVVEGCRMDRQVRELGERSEWVVQRGVDRRARKRLREAEHHTLRAPSLGEVVVRNRDGGLAVREMVIGRLLRREMVRR